MFNSKRNFVMISLLLATGMLIIFIAGDGWPTLRGPAPGSDIWYWEYRPTDGSNIALYLLSLGLSLTLAIYWLQVDTTRRATVVVLPLLSATTFMTQLGVVNRFRHDLLAELIDLTLAVNTSGYFWTAATLDDLGETMANYPAAMADFESSRAQTHPPGLVLLNRLTIDALTYFPRPSEWIASKVWPRRCTDLWLYNQPPAAAAALGIWAFVPLLFWSTAVPAAYSLARQIEPNSLAGAKMATLMTAFLPAGLFFVTADTQLFAALTVWATLFFVLGLKQARAALLLLAGGLLSFNSYLSIGNLTLVVVLLAVGWWLNRTRPLHHHWRWLVPFGSGVASIWLISWAVTGVPPWAIIATALDYHYQLSTALRSYQRWVVFNLQDLLLFTGIPAAAGLLGWLFLPFKTKRWSWPMVWAIALVVYILFLNFQGSTRGEVGRIWLFFMPLLTIVAGLFWGQFFQERRALILLAGGQLALAAVIGLSWQGVEAVIVRALPPPFFGGDTADLPLINQQFGDTFTLDRGEVVYNQQNHHLEVTEVIEVQQTAPRPLTRFYHVLNMQGEIVAQLDQWPHQGQWPPSCWQAGEVLAEQLVIPLPEELPAGSYLVRTGWYDTIHLTRLSTAEGADSLLLTQIEIERN